MTAKQLWTIALIILILGVLTLVPSPGASKANLIGYKSKCSFTPISTLIMFAIAAVVLIMRTRRLQ